MMVHSHKEGIHNNAERDEQFHKRIKDDDWTKLLKINPARAAVPNAAEIYTLQTLRQTPFFELGLFLLLLLSVCWKIIDGHWIMFKYGRLVACGRGLSTLRWHTTHTTNYECHAHDKGARFIISCIKDSIKQTGNYSKRNSLKAQCTSTSLATKQQRTNANTQRENTNHTYRYIYV